MSLPWVDYVIIAIIGLSVFTGLFRGFIKELIALCIWILAIWLAYTYWPLLDSYLTSYIQDKTARMAVSFVAILLLTLIVGGLINAILSFILRRSGLSGTDRLLGMGFGFMRGVFIVSLLILAFKITAIPTQDYTGSSHLYTKFDPLVNYLYGYMPNLIEKVGVYDKKDHLMQRDTKDIKIAP